MCTAAYFQGRDANDERAAATAAAATAAVQRKGQSFQPRRERGGQQRPRAVGIDRVDQSNDFDAVADHLHGPCANRLRVDRRLPEDGEQLREERRHDVLQLLVRNARRKLW